MLTALRSRGIVFAVALLSTFRAYPQNADETRIDGQPLIYVKDGHIHGCGVRFIGFQLGTDSIARSWDISVNFYADGFAAVKGMSYELDARRLGTSDPPRVMPIQSAWVKAPNEPAPQPLSGAHDGEDSGSKIYAVSFDAAVKVFLATIAQEEMMLGIRRKGENGERIAFGRVNLSEAERRQLDQCVRELLTEIK
jgi:hypothetical protein